MQKVNKSGVETGVVSGGRVESRVKSELDWTGQCNMEQRLGEWGKWGRESWKGKWSAKSNAKRSGHWSRVGEVLRRVFQAP